MNHIQLLEQQVSRRVGQLSETERELVRVMGARSTASELAEEITQTREAGQYSEDRIHA